MGKAPLPPKAREADELILQFWGMSNNRPFAVHAEPKNFYCAKYIIYLHFISAFFRNFDNPIEVIV